MSKIIIRSATAKDAQAITDIILKTWKTTYSDLLDESVFEKREAQRAEKEESLIKTLKDKDTLAFLVAEINGTVVGFIDAYSSDEEKYKDFVEIGNFFVLKEFQHMGIGKKLFNTCVTKLKELGHSQIMLYTFEKTSARLFYQRNGGKMVETRDVNFGKNNLKEEIYTFEM